MKIFDCQKVNNIPHKNKLELEKIQQFSTQIILLANIPIQYFLIIKNWSDFYML